MSKPSDSHFRYFLRDLGYLLKEASLEAKQEFSNMKEKPESSETDLAFASGRALAYYEVISLMQQQAAAFQLNLRDLSLNDIDANKDLL